MKKRREADKESAKTQELDQETAICRTRLFFLWESEQREREREQVGAQTMHLQWVLFCTAGNCKLVQLVAQWAEVNS